MRKKMDKETLREITEKLFLPKEEWKRRKRIRKRKSYQFWKELAEKIQEGDIELILTSLDQRLNEMRAYGSATRAHYFWESLRLLLKDLRGEM